MKKIIAFILALATVLALSACGTSSAPAGNNNPVNNGGAATPNNATAAPAETTVPAAAEMSTTAANTIGGTVEYTLVNVYTTNDVMPPKPSSVYTHYEATAGNIYVVAVMDVKNIGTASVDAEDLMKVTMNIGGTTFAGNCVVEEDGGAGLGYANITPVAALGTARLYYLFQVPEASSTDSMVISAIVGTETQSATVGLAQFESQIKTLVKGDVITDDTTLSATVEDVYFSNTLYPPIPDGYYTYYEAASGKTYMIVKLNVKNLKGSDLKYDSIAGVTCVYNDKYKYTTFGVLEEDGGTDLNGYPGQYAIAPLDSGVIYYLAEVPAEVANGPVVVTLYIAGQYYKYNIG